MHHYSVEWSMVSNATLDLIVILCTVTLPFISERLYYIIIIEQGWKLTESTH